MIVTPVSVSPAMIARSIGAAPRHLGISEGCTFSISSSESSGSRISWPNAHTTPTSAPLARIRSTDPWSLTPAVWCSSMPSSPAAAATGEGASLRPRPRGRSGGVTTRTGRCGEAASRRSTATANPEVPR